MHRSIITASALATLLPLAAEAAVVNLKITIENLAPMQSLGFAPLRLGLHSGVYDGFNLGDVATPAIVSVAEGGSGSAWFPAFAAADPTAVLGTVLPDPAGPLLPGATGTSSFVVDTSVNPFFSFAAMVIPSNDFFIGNDSPTAYRLFDDDGNLQIMSITQHARDVWDAGSEVFDAAAAAFVGDNDLRADQGSVVAFNFAELAAFDGLLTGAGYVFDSQLAADTALYRISFETSPVPIPASLPLLAGALGVLGVWRRRRG